MLNQKQQISLSLTSALILTLAACDKEPPASASRIDKNATYQGPTQVDTKLGGRDVSIDTPGALLGSNTTIQSANVTGLPLGAQQGAGMYNTASDEYLVFATSTTGSSTNSTAAFDASGYIGANAPTHNSPYTPLNNSAPTKIVGIDYAYYVGQKGQTPTVHGASNGVITLTDNTLTGTFGGVQLNGDIDGMEIKGEATLLGNTGAKGTFNGLLADDGTTPINTLPYGGVMGIFVGDNSAGKDDTSFAGGFYK